MKPLNISRISPKTSTPWVHTLIAILITFSGKTSAEIIFEGYASLTAGDAPLGYIIQSYEFDAQKKQFTSTYLIKTRDVSESLKAIANDKFQPVSFMYTSLGPQGAKMVDAKVKNGQLVGTIGDGKTAKKFQRKLTTGVFFSSFLGYLMLQKGIGVGKNFVYKAIAEEDGETHSGEAWIKEETTYKGLVVYRIENKFKAGSFVSFVTKKGEVLATSSQDSNVRTELKANPTEATQGFSVPSSALIKLFGRVPTGTKNSLHVPVTTADAPSALAEAPKSPTNQAGPKSSTEPAEDQSKTEKSTPGP